MASHLESLICEYLDWQGYVVRRNVKVGKRKRGGWEMELDVIAYQHKTRDLVHYEPSLDALKWDAKEARYRKKFEAAQKYMYSEVFPWLADIKPPVRQVAVLITHPRRRDTIAGGSVQSVDELMAEIRSMVEKCKIMASAAIPEQYPLLRTLQLTHVGYYQVLDQIVVGDDGTGRAMKRFRVR